MAGGEISVGCVIAGGGPAGIMLGFLLARAGVAVTVLEKHADFLRDFRGDTIHPSTLELMHELGLLDTFLARPHHKVARFGAQIGDDYLQVADFSGLPVHCPYIALMPQWDFLDFLAGQGKRDPGFRLAMQTEVTALLHDDAGRVIGVRATGSEGEVTLRGQLVVAADGRHSTSRAAAGLVSRDIGAPMDVLWLRLSRRPQDGAEQAAFRVGAGRLFVQIDRGDYWQCAFVIPKGGFDRLRQRPIAEFRDEIVGPAPHFADRVGEIAGWGDVSLLTVAVDRLPQWHRPGLLCIGDAAHAMSPIGGVGINLAIQDAVAAANRLAGPLQRDTVTDADLAAVQRRREFPTRATQALQVFIQNRVHGRILTSTSTPSPPLALRLLQHLPALQRLPARLIGIGLRPEHIATPSAQESWAWRLDTLISSRKDNYVWRKEQSTSVGGPVSYQKTRASDRNG